MTPPTKADDPRGPRTPLVFLLVFAALLLLHLPLLRLPYYWDEAGYFIPAARDIYTDGSFIPHSTLSNAHPPLVMAYLALAWKLFGFRIEVARVAMLLVSALALAGLFRLAGRVSNARVAAATVVTTALYPVFFAQSSLAHLDMTAAALTLWGLFLYLPPAATGRQGDVGTGRQVDEKKAGLGEEDAGADVFDESRGLRRAMCVAVFALAGLAKETALLAPFVLFAWELLCLLVRRRERLAALVCVGRPRSVAWSAALLVACVPLALWLAYHRARTGYTFGNPEYFRYNVASTLSPERLLYAAWERLKHVTFHMNLWALTLTGLAAMFLKPRRDRGVERVRIDVPVQMLFAALILAQTVALSFVGGAVLARYLLPVLPLLILIWVSTLWRRAPLWPLAVALVCAAFVYRLEVNPPYSFPWEDNLAYRDFVLLHRDAAQFLSEKYAGARVLTSWPATDELKNPYLGYTPRPLEVYGVADFKPETLQRAAGQKSDYDAALIYSTHGGLNLEEAARLLGGRVVFKEERKGQWVAVIEK
ncbi:MAG: glycosyltransferase family 39 protein [Acidobacteriota bacterium]|nr:glycosyltransferase family 39 protein [Acidobacteriota bacterium]